MAISWSRSDWHQGETVLHLQFSQGPGVYYKPRSLQPEVVLAQWFEAFRSVGVPVAPLPPMVAKKAYGWMQEVPRARLESRQEVRAWFYSAGALLAAAWILGLRDLHWENVVAGREGPVVVDGECWAQPLGQEEEAADSALASGLLTMPSPGPSSFREDGALLGGTDPRAQSLPLWRGRPAPVEAFAQELLAGFEESLQRLAKAVKERGPWSQCWAELRGLAVRWVPRPSEAYAQLLSSLLGSPKVREGWQANLVTEVLLRPLVASQEKKPSWWSWAQEEQEALLRLSVPRLTLSTGRRGGLFRLSGRQAISRRLARLSEAVIQKQKQAVGAAFPPKASSQDQEAFFRQQAHQVAQELLAQKPPAHLDLACGLAGKALAWAAWARVSSDTEAFQQVRAFYQRLLEALPRPWPGALGLCTGLGGVVYSLTAGAALLGEGAWAEEAFHLLETADFLASEVWDVEGGLAGLLLGSWALAAGKPQLREKLVRGAHALWQMLPNGHQGSASNGQLAGFAHGFSGVAAALALVGEVAGVQELKEKAWVLLAREPKKGPWLAPGRTSSGTHLPVPLQGWCHGAPGVYLARLLALPLAGPEVLLAQKQEALTILLQAPLFGASSLCCGSIARSEILLIGAQREGRSELLQQAKTRTQLFCRLRPWRGKLPAEGGLFAGLEGLLFHLSRLLAPEEVGSVLFGQIPGRG
jgi:lantibiotic modifying enzyme